MIFLTENEFIVFSILKKARNTRKLFNGIGLRTMAKIVLESQEGDNLSLLEIYRALKIFSFMSILLPVGVAMVGKKSYLCYSFYSPLSKILISSKDDLLQIRKNFRSTIQEIAILTEQKKALSRELLKKRKKLGKLKKWGLAPFPKKLFPINYKRR